MSRALFSGSARDATKPRVSNKQRQKSRPIRRTDSEAAEREFTEIWDPLARLRARSLRSVEGGQSATPDRGF